MKVILILIFFLSLTGKPEFSALSLRVLVSVKAFLHIASTNNSKFHHCPSEQNVWVKRTHARLKSKSPRDCKEIGSVVEILHFASPVGEQGCPSKLSFSPNHTVINLVPYQPLDLSILLQKVQLKWKERKIWKMDEWTPCIVVNILLSKENYILFLT